MELDHGMVFGERLKRLRERVYNHFSEKMEEDLKTAINAIKF